jgi:hypothetical protein
MAKKKRRGACIFCGAHCDLTREDVFPVWAANEKHTERILKGSIGGTEATVKPEQARGLARWGILKSLTVDYMQPPRDRVSTEEDRLALIDSDDVPEGFFMSLARYDTHRGRRAFHTRAVLGVTYEEHRYLHSQLMTMVLGCLVVQTTFVGAETMRATRMGFRIPDDDWRLHVWPQPNDDTVWPPPNTVGQDDIVKFADIGWLPKSPGDVLPEEVPSRTFRATYPPPKEP